MNDDRDTEAIAEAVTGPTMRFVDMQTLHRARDRLGGELHCPDQLAARRSPGARRRNLERELDAMLCEDHLAVSPRLPMLIEEMREEWRVLDRRIAAFDDAFTARAKNDEAARRAPGSHPRHRRAECGGSFRGNRRGHSRVDAALPRGSVLCGTFRTRRAIVIFASCRSTAPGLLTAGRCPGNQVPNVAL